MRGPFWVSTPENSKTDKKRSAGSPLSKPAAIGAFQPCSPVHAMWEAMEKSARARSAEPPFSAAGPLPPDSGPHERACRMPEMAPRAPRSTGKRTADIAASRRKLAVFAADQTIAASA